MPYLNRTSSLPYEAPPAAPSARQPHPCPKTARPVALWTRNVYSAMLAWAVLGVLLWGLAPQALNAQTWNAQTSGTSQALWDVSFVNASTGWVAGDNGTIRHTTNGGTTWSGQTSGTTNLLRGVVFVDANTGWVAGYGGTILHTTNGGTTWTAQTSGTGSNLQDVAFANANTGWVVGSSGTILHTTNGGTTWTAQTSGTSNSLSDLAFVSTSMGWTAGAGGTILHTNNGGTTWTAQTSGTSEGLQGVDFVDANTGWTVGNNGTILHTTNGSLPVELTHFEATLDGHDALLTWKTASETNNAGFEIQRISKNDGASPLWQALGFVDGHGTTELPQSYAYRVEALEPGRHVFRLKQIDFDGTFEYHPEVEVVVEMTERFFVEPAYPNPFNPQARLRFAVQRAQAVEVGLFDLLGRRVAVLYTGMASAGQVQEVWIDGSALPSGLYVVRVQGASFVETQLVTLLK